jgi:DNA-binding NtrC family response regulator
MTEHEPAQQMSGDGSSAFDGTQQAKLLVIDDDASICMVIEKLGEKAGFTSKHAVAVEEAKLLLHAERFDCITLDLSIGKDTGIELLSVLREMECTTPVIIISGSMRSMRDFAVSIGDQMHLAVQEPFAKPIDFARLKQALVGVRKKMAAQQHVAPAA